MNINIEKYIAEEKILSAILVNPSSRKDILRGRLLRKEIRNYLNAQARFAKTAARVEKSLNK